MNQDIMHRYITDGLNALNEMEEASRRGAACSRESLQQLLLENADTEYGRKHHFAQISSYEAFVREVPLSDYSDYEPYIRRMLENNEKNLITACDVNYYCHTSGTTGVPKMIPKTREDLGIFFRYAYQSMFGLCDRTCREAGKKGMPDHKGLLIAESRIQKNAQGVSIGALSESIFFPEDTAGYNILPPDLIYTTYDFDRRHLKMLYALRERHLSFMMGTFSPLLYDMLQYVQYSCELLCSDIETGRINAEITIDPRLRKKLEKEMRPNPERAEEIRRIMKDHADGAFVPLLWPDMQMVAAIGSSVFQPATEKLRTMLGPDIMFHFLSYSCSEMTIAVEINPDDPTYMLLPFGGFCEFLPVEGNETGTPLLMDQLEIGKEYEVIITNLSGFYRYRLGDVIRVTGFHNECPMVVVSYRKSQLANLHGEKISEEVFQKAIDELSQETGTAILEYSVCPDTDAVPDRYIVLLEADRIITPDRWQRYSDVLEEKLCRMHDSYRDKIQQKTLAPLDVRFVEPQTYALYRDMKIMGGASPNQIKPVRVITDNRLRDFFFGLLQD